MSHTKIENIDCYGVMHEGQNIEIVCVNENNDGLLPQGFNTWKQAVSWLKENWNGDIVELSAV